MISSVRHQGQTWSKIEPKFKNKLPLSGCMLPTGISGAAALRRLRSIPACDCSIRTCNYLSRQTEFSCYHEGRPLRRRDTGCQRLACPDRKKFTGRWKSPSGRKPQLFDNANSFFHPYQLVCFNISEKIDMPIWPANFDLVSSFCRAHSKVKPKIVLR
jgi:hypothetical protein